MRTTERPGGGSGSTGDVNTRGVLFFGLWLAAGTIAAAIAMFALFRSLEKKQRGEDRKLSPMIAASLARTPPEPRLEAYPLAPRQVLSAQEDEVLTTYAWVDKDRGIARIPIDRAMEILVERGLPQAAAPAPPPSSAVPAERTQ